MLIANNFGNVFVTGNNATTFAAEITAAVSGQTTAPSMSLTTVAGLLTINGSTANANSGSITLNGFAGVALNATLGSATTGAINITGALSGAGDISTGNGTVTINQTGNSTYAGAMSGTQPITKTGSGTLTLSAASNYTNTTTISNGTLLIDGSLTSNVTVHSGATLGGSGVVQHVLINNGGILSPGNGPGLLNSTDITFTSGGIYRVDLNGTNLGTGYDQTNVTGSVNLGGATLSLTPGFMPAEGDVFVIINNDATDAITGTFNGYSEGSIINVSGIPYRITYVGGTGNDVVLVVDAAVPSVIISTPLTPTNASPILVTVTFSEPVNNFVVSDIAIAGTALRNCLRLYHHR